MRTLSRKKQRQLFLAQAVKLLLTLNAQQDGGETYRFTLQTKAGPPAAASRCRPAGRTGHRIHSLR